MQRTNVDKKHPVQVVAFNLSSLDDSENTSGDHTFKQTSGEIQAFLRNISNEKQKRQLWLLFCFLLCSSRHQQQVAGHELDVQHIAGVSSVHSHQFAR